MRLNCIYRALVALMLAQECTSWVGTTSGKSSLSSSTIFRLNKRSTKSRSIPRVNPSVTNLHMAADTIVSPFDSSSGQPAAASTGTTVLEIVRPYFLITIKYHFIFIWFVIIII